MFLDVLVSMCFFSCNSQTTQSLPEKTVQIPFTEIQTKVPPNTKEYSKVHLLDYAMLGDDFDYNKNLREYKHICRPEENTFSEQTEIPTSIQPKYAIVEVSADAILLSGEKILELENFQIPAQGASLLVRDLYSAFQDLASPRKQFSRTLADENCRFTGTLLFIFHEDMPLGIQRIIFFNAGQAEFSQHHFLVQPKDKPPILQGKKLQGFFWVEQYELPSIGHF